MLSSIRPVSVLRFWKRASHFGNHTIRLSILHACMEKMKKATSLWLFRIFAALSLLGLASLLVLELFSTLGQEVWLIEFLLVGLTAYVYVIALINGHWCEQKHRFELDPTISLLMLALLLLLVVACIRTLVFHESSLIPYWEVMGVALMILLATTLVAFIER